jgi:hypothetical protein
MPMTYSLPTNKPSSTPTPVMDLYYVDCFNAEFWILADSEGSACDIAANECGHTDVNECLSWDETIWGSQYESQTEAELAIGSLKRICQ